MSRFQERGKGNDKLIYAIKLPLRSKKQIFLSTADVTSIFSLNFII
jgi:hypothetical protein